MVGQVEKWVPGLVGLPLAKATFLLTAFYTYRARQTLVPVRVSSLPIARPFLAFIWLAILSIIFSIYKSNTLKWSESAAILLIAFVVLVKITQTMRAVERMTVALAASAALLSLGVLLNYKGGRAHINNNFDPNDVAYCLDTLLPIVIAVGAAAQSKRMKWIAYGLAPVVGCAVLLTGSLGGVLGLGVVLVAVITYPIGLSKARELRKFALARLLVQVSIIAILGVPIWAHLPQATRSRLFELSDLQHNYNMGDSKTSRLVIWRTQAKLAIERPIGYGLGSAPTADGLLGGGAYFTSHDSSLQAFIELGALGLFLFLYAYYITWKELGAVLKKPPQPLLEPDSTKMLLYARGFRIALMGNIVAGLFLSEAYSSCMWMTVAVCTAFVNVSTAKSTEGNRTARTTGPAETPSSVSAEGPADSPTRGGTPGRSTDRTPVGRVSGTKPHIRTRRT
ncbi:MAG TPA: O-antigen ligase family protein [Steroidobacteraceae bacterium]|nr:O-antigen ligase family protein [Steroidobacteraceae bacterium]